MIDLLAERPGKEIRAGNIHASIWKNEHITLDWQWLEIQKVILEEIYRDCGGKLKHTFSFPSNDIPKDITVIKRAEYLLQLSENGGPWNRSRYSSTSD